MPDTLVIGLGNPLMGDDGVGLAALARLREDWRLDGVTLLDGGTWGLSLLPDIEDADRLVLVDAIAAHRQPGEIVVLERGDLPIYLSRKLSPHQVDMKDALALAEWRGRLPHDVVAIGVQPDVVELGTELSEAVGSQLDALVCAVVRHLEGWGHRCAPVTEPTHA
ncbi:MAG: HyaD/HybD family hydrogenase maturation endopeptidase [Gemmatimonadota bacterium]|nr:HyaD/HybD family hydrogenase maturation endopeptidase [Gemmatimonadota bacterium]